MNSWSRNPAAGAPVPALMESDHPVPADHLSLPERGFAVDRRKALITAGFLWAAFAAMVFAVTHALTATVDSGLLRLFRSGPDLSLAGPRLVLETVRDVTALGGVFLRNLFALGAVVALLFFRLRREALILGATVVSGWIANSALKLLVGRERPMIVPHLTEAGGESFPSGHSFGAAVVYIGIAIAFAAMSRRQSVRYTIIGAALVLSAMVAASRVVLGVHFPSDVVAGWLGGAGWAFLAAALFYRPAESLVPPDR
ncbi:phosphatase PAP2 family protein [Qipengyuania spongiae]|uniref:Phosphatase PAP2 family protein n=1 Tax=Qipengyuania spongiae TaxID=2909673 RepID=A0ABY5T190_9SPHN|nr:phosphatase PAP2 family protein [Qipengyuania spongiae]UVI39021.1 phosphatase PAP2 family protein [Qipengyuania spongiae]